MIIECPSCKTKFSVDAAQVRSVKHPRFHCSRCDHFFEHNAEEKRDRSGKPSDPAAEQLPLLPENKPPRTKRPSLSAELTKEENLGITADWPDKPQTEVHAADLRQAVALSMVSKSRAAQVEAAPPRVEARPVSQPQPSTSSARPAPTAAWPDTATEKPAASQIQSRTEVLKDDLAKRLSALAQSHTETPSASELDTERRPEQEAPWWEAPESSTPPEKPGLVRARIQPPAPPPVAKLSSVVPFPEKSQSADAFVDIPNGAFALGSGEPVREIQPPPAGASKLRYSSPRFFSHPLVIIGSFPAALCLGFLVWSLNISQTPEGLKQLLKLDAASLPRVPPPGVQVIDLSSEMVTLDDGRQVLQISGNVFNGTTEPVKEVKVEASLYDQENHEIKNLVADSANGLLAAARLTSLDESTLHNLQRKSVAPMKKLNPNEREPFKVIFTSPLDQAAWFTARVYSVKLS